MYACIYVCSSGSPPPFGTPLRAPADEISGPPTQPTHLQLLMEGRIVELVINAVS